jgi:ketosteroid isomerase-like protein
MATYPKPAPMLTDEEMIRAIPQEFIRYHNERNINGLVNLFTDDGRTMVPFRPVAQGKTALRQSFQRDFDEFDPRTLKVETTDVEVFGDIAFSLGTFNLNLKTPTGKRIDDHGKWLATSRRVGTTWKIVAHCYNSDLPITTFTT